MLLIKCKYCNKSFDGDSEIIEHLQHETSCKVGEKQRIIELKQRITKIKNHNKNKKVKY